MALREGANERAWRFAAATTGLVVGLDQITKQIAAISIARDDSVNVFFLLDITNIRNKGIAFGALKGAGLVVLGLTIVALVALLVYFALNPMRRMLWLPVGMIAGGALGNLADRARIGAVIDFIDPTFWPAFNVADAAVVLGILGLLYVVEGED
jgi:signal peptidase II